MYTDAMQQVYSNDQSAGRIASGLTYCTATDKKIMQCQAPQMPPGMDGQTSATSGSSRTSRACNRTDGFPTRIFTHRDRETPLMRAQRAHYGN
jgi:hypothetical protein